MPRRTACLVLPLLLAGCQQPAAGGDALLITIDTLRADHVGLYGYERPTTPHLDRRFADAAVFERSYSTAASTSISVVSLLSGLLPQEHGIRLHYQLVPPELPLLPDLLPAAWQSAAFVSNVVLTDEALGIAARFDHYDDYVDQLESGRGVFERDARRTTDAALAWLATERDPARPLFLWVHYIDPHGPYRPPADFPRTLRSTERREIDPARVPEYQREPGVSDGMAYVDGYDEEIRFTDRELERLLAGYGERFDLDAALVVVTADHGESMMDHEQWFTHTYHVYEELVRVPLLLRGPGVPPGRRKALVSGLDVAPTILAFAGAPVPAALSGRDLRRPKDDPERIVFVEGYDHRQQWRGAVEGDGKWMAAVPRRRRGPAAVLTDHRRYDLAADPGELAPLEWTGLASAESALIERVQADPQPAGAPRDHRAGHELEGPKRPPVPADAAEKLRALGYLDDAAGLERPPGPDAPEPARPARDD